MTKALDSLDDSKKVMVSRESPSCEDVIRCDGLTVLNVDQILAWADSHRAVHGTWPEVGPETVSGAIAGVPGESWKAINHALALGLRGLPGDSSLAELLAAHRNAPLPDMGPKALADKIWAWEQEEFRTRGLKRRPGKGRQCPPLTIGEILAWADAHRAATGRFPQKGKGRVQAAPYQVTWCGIDSALKKGHRGLPGGSSLSCLLGHHRALKPRLTHEQIVAWADAYHAAHRRWPTSLSGPVDDATEETWAALDQKLRKGGRGLSGGISLAALLIKYRGPEATSHPRLTLEVVRAWAEGHHATTGKWPTGGSGVVRDAPYEITWQAIARALSIGHRGLPSGGSLARLRPGAGESRPQLTHELILAWADAHRAVQGSWPKQSSGKVCAAPRESWAVINGYLRDGGRGLPGGSCLGRLLVAHRGVRNRRFLPALTIEQILAWADAYHAAHGVWPRFHGARVDPAPGVTWCAIGRSLSRGRRGLPGGTTLVRLLVEHRGRQVRNRAPALTVEQILAWADAYHSATGRWPNATSGAIAGVSGENWSKIQNALHRGHRGLAGRTSIAALLKAHRGVGNSKALSGLSVDQILAWADAHHAAHGVWPSVSSGPVAGAPGETWGGIAKALTSGGRGLAACLRRLAARRRPSE